MKVGTILTILFGLLLLMDWFNNDLSTNNYYKANAALGSSKVQLVINEWAITCTWWLWTLNMWSVNAQFAASNMTWTYGSNVWNCMDTKWSLTWGFTIRITWDLIGSTAWTTISSWAATICQTTALLNMQGSTASPALTTTIPTCASTTWMIITQDLIRRTSTFNWQIYQYWITPRIMVAVPQNQAPGTYTWVIEIGIP